MNDESQPRKLTRFEREIDAAARFDPREIVSYRPVEQLCDVCGRKHFGLSTTCSFCVGCP